MTHSIQIKDRIRQGTTTVGVGTLSLDVSYSSSGFQDFSVLGNGTPTYYAIEESPSQWEVGIGTYSSSTLTRDTILDSSNGGTPISLGGSGLVFVTYPAAKSVFEDTDKNIHVTGVVVGVTGVKFNDGTIQTTAAQGYDWIVADGAGNNETIGSGDTVYWSGVGATDVTYDTATNIISISGGGGGGGDTYYDGTGLNLDPSTTFNVSGATIDNSGIAQLTNTLSQSSGLAATPYLVSGVSGVLQSELDSQDGRISSNTSTILGHTVNIANNQSNILSNDTDIATVSGLLYNYWTVSDGSTTENIAKEEQVTFTGEDNTTVSYDPSSNTVTISGTSAGGYDWNVADGNGNSELVGSGDTVYWSGIGGTDVTYSSSTNIVSISGYDSTYDAGTGLVLDPSTTFNVSGATIDNSGIAQLTNAVTASSGLAITPYAVSGVSGDLQNNIGTVNALATTNLGSIITNAYDIATNTTNISTNDTDISNLSGLVYSYWTVQGDGAATGNVDDTEVVQFTGAGNVSVTLGSPDNRTVTISGDDVGSAYYAGTGLNLDPTTYFNVSGATIDNSGIAQLTNTITDSSGLAVTPYAVSGVSGVLQSAIDTNTTDISTNDTDISNLSGLVATNTTDISTNDTDISNLSGLVSTNTTDIAANGTDITTVSGLLYNHWTISDGSNTENIAKEDQVNFTGAGNSTVSYDTASNTVTVSGANAGAYDWNVADGNGNSELIASGDTVYFSGDGLTDVTYDSATNIISVSGSEYDWSVADGNGNSEAVTLGDTVYFSGVDGAAVDYDSATNIVSISGSQGVSRVACRMVATGVTSVPEQSSTQISLDTIDYQYGSISGTTANNGRIYLLESGVYLINAQVQSSGNNSVRHSAEVEIWKNGAEMPVGQSSYTVSSDPATYKADNPTRNASVVVTGISGDYYDVRLWHDASSSTAADTTMSDSCWLSVVKLEGTKGDKGDQGPTGGIAAYYASKGLYFDPVTTFNVSGTTIDSSGMVQLTNILSDSSGLGATPYLVSGVSGALQSDIDTNAANISTNDTDISNLSGLVSTNTTNISTNDTDISNLSGLVATNTTDISTNDTDISNLSGLVATNTTDISTNDTDISNLSGLVATNTTDISTNDTDISNLSGLVATNTTDISTNDTDISNLSGLVYNYWTVQGDSADTGNVDNTEVVQFTGAGNVSVTLGSTDNRTVTISGDDVSNTYTANTGLVLVGGTEFNTSGTGNFSAITFDNDSQKIRIGHGVTDDGTFTIHIGPYAGLDMVGQNTLSTFIGPGGNGIGGVGQQASGCDNANAIGYLAAYKASGAEKSNMIGVWAGRESSDSSYSNILGYQAAFDASGASYSNMLGYKAGYQATGGSAHTQMLGTHAGRYTDDCDYSNFMGYEAGNNAARIDTSNVIGYRAGKNAEDHDNANMIGCEAGAEALSGDKSNMIGCRAGYESRGESNQYIGYQAGILASGTGNIEIVTEGANPSIIGANDSKLHIDNTIVGDMSSKKLAIGDVGASHLSPDATLEILPRTGTDVGLIVQPLDPNPTANLTEWQSGDATILAKVTSEGCFSGQCYQFADGTSQTTSSAYYAGTGLNLDPSTTFNVSGSTVLDRGIVQLTNTITDSSGLAATPYAVSGVSGSLQSAIDTNGTDIDTVSGLLYNHWTISDGANSENITKEDQVNFTGGGNTTVSYDTASNTVTVSGTSAGGYDWTIADGDGNSEVIPSGDTIYFSGVDGTEVSYDTATNIVSISGAAGSSSAVSDTTSRLVSISTPTTIPEDAWTEIGLDTLGYEAGNISGNISNGRIYLEESGLYLISTQGSIDTDIADETNFVCGVRKNGLPQNLDDIGTAAGQRSYNDNISLTYTYKPVNNASVVTTGISGDYFSAWGYQENGGGGVDADTELNSTWLSVTKLVAGKGDTGATGPAGAGEDYDWTIADGNGNSEVVPSGDTIYFSGVDGTDVSYDTATNIVSISGGASTATGVKACSLITSTATAVEHEVVTECLFDTIDYEYGGMTGNVSVEESGRIYFDETGVYLLTAKTSFKHAEIGTIAGNFGLGFQKNGDYDGHGGDGLWGEDSQTVAATPHDDVTMSCSVQITGASGDYWNALLWNENSTTTTFSNYAPRTRFSAVKLVNGTKGDTGATGPAGAGEDYDWNVADGNGNSETVSSGDTVYWSGVDGTDVTYDPSTNIFSIAGGSSSSTSTGNVSCQLTTNTYTTCVEMAGTDLEFNIVDHQIGNISGDITSTSPQGRIYLQESGVYLLTSYANFKGKYNNISTAVPGGLGSLVGSWGIGFSKNGSHYRWSANDFTNQLYSDAGDIELNAGIIVTGLSGDYFSSKIWQANGSSSDVRTSTDQPSFLTMTKLETREGEKGDTGAGHVTPHYANLRQSVPQSVSNDAWVQIEMDTTEDIYGATTGNFGIKIERSGLYQINYQLGMETTYADEEHFITVWTGTLSDTISADAVIGYTAFNNNSTNSNLYGSHCMQWNLPSGVYVYAGNWFDDHDGRSYSDDTTAHANNDRRNPKLQIHEVI